MPNLNIIFCRFNGQNAEMILQKQEAASTRKCGGGVNKVFWPEYIRLAFLYLSWGFQREFEKCTINGKGAHVQQSGYQQGKYYL